MINSKVTTLMISKMEDGNTLGFAYGNRRVVTVKKCNRSYSTHKEPYYVVSCYDIERLDAWATQTSQAVTPPQTTAMVIAMLNGGERS